MAGVDGVASRILTALDSKRSVIGMATHQLNGNIGTDPNFTPATHTGHSRSHVKASHDHPKVKLTAEEQEIYDGKKGDVLQKAIKTVVAYGELFGAEKLVDLGGAPLSFLKILSVARRERR
jgi:hypothetical protein